MEYEKSASGSVYLIKSDKGYWLPGGFGYTSNKAEAGRFSVADMASLNLQVLADRRRIRGAARVPGRTQSGAGRG
ncbi:hypothetical protein [Escherichia coli]